jgi:hypothetical protein
MGLMKLIWTQGTVGSDDDKKAEHFDVYLSGTALGDPTRPEVPPADWSQLGELLMN